ncbi:MAG: type II toxin-antitoxin system prevent-host-death family antitoxin [Chloroflexi bacterium]|nr:type II toxin-antitoxin system prevent-host-death family antitoxin [Chloroflexota bacterium]
MQQIQSTEAKARFAELLRTVERGETVVITRHGKAVAHIVPAHARERTERQQAVDQFLRRRNEWQGATMTREEILAARHEGHSR